MAVMADAWRGDVSVQGGALRQACASLCHGPQDDPPLTEQAND